MPSRQELLDSIKSKYPQYKDIDDNTLASAISEKYPVYRDVLFDTAAATSRLSQESQLQNLIGGTMLDPTTSQPVYSPEQQAQDARAVGLLQGSQNLENLQRKVQEGEFNQQTGALTSAGVGAASVPIGLTQLIGELVRKSVGNEAFQQAFPLSDQQGSMIQEDIEQITGANPLAAAVGSAVMNRGITPGMGGGLRSLAQGETAQGLKDIGIGGLSNVVVGTGLRGALGEETGTGDILTDIALGGAAGGRRPDLEENLRTAIRNAPSKTITPIIESDLVQKGITKTKGLFVRKEGDIFAKLLDIPDGDKAATKRLNQGLHDKLLPEVVGNADAENAQGLLNGARTSLRTRSEIVEPTISGATTEEFNKHLGIVKIKEEVRNSLKGEFSAKADLDDAMTHIDDVLSDFNQGNALEKQRAINRDVSSYQKRLVDPKGQQLKAKDALRDVISVGIKDLLEERGVDKSIYRDMSGLIDIVDNLDTNIQKQSKRQREVGGTRLTERLVGQDIPSRAGVIKGVIQTIKGGPKDQLEDLASSIFKKVKGANPNFKIPPKLTQEEELQQLGDKFRAAALRQRLPDFTKALSQRELDLLPEAQARALQEPINQIPFSPSPEQIMQTQQLENMALEDRLRQILLEQNYPRFP